MSDPRLRDHLRTQLGQLKETGLYKRERLIQTPQGPSIRVGGKDVVNFCANNYLGLANHPEIVRAAHDGLDHYGYGLSSVRFICGTQDLHRQLEGDDREVLRQGGRDPLHRPASTPTAGCSRRSSARTTRSSATS